MGFRFHVRSASRLRLARGETILLDGEIQDGTIEPGATATAEGALQVRVGAVALMNRPTAPDQPPHTLRIDEPPFPIALLIGKTLVG
jgi:hypothetical protein